MYLRTNKLQWLFNSYNQTGWLIDLVVQSNSKFIYILNQGILFLRSVNCCLRRRFLFIPAFPTCLGEFQLKKKKNSFQNQRQKIWLKSCLILYPILQDFHFYILFISRSKVVIIFFSDQPSINEEFQVIQTYY